MDYRWSKRTFLQTAPRENTTAPAFQLAPLKPACPAEQELATGYCVFELLNLTPVMRSDLGCSQRKVSV